jgi:hypothetical protein
MSRYVNPCPRGISTLPYCETHLNCHHPVGRAPHSVKMSEHDHPRVPHQNSRRSHAKERQIHFPSHPRFWGEGGESTTTGERSHWEKGEMVMTRQVGDFKGRGDESDGGWAVARQEASRIDGGLPFLTVRGVALWWQEVHKSCLSSRRLPFTSGRRPHVVLHLREVTCGNTFAYWRTIVLYGSHHALVARQILAGGITWCLADETISRTSTKTLNIQHSYKVKAIHDSKSYCFPLARLLLGLYNYRFKHLAIPEEINTTTTSKFHFSYNDYFDDEDDVSLIKFIHS